MQPEGGILFVGQAWVCALGMEALEEAIYKVFP